MWFVCLVVFFMFCSYVGFLVDLLVEILLLRFWKLVKYFGEMGMFFCVIFLGRLVLFVGM